MAAIPEQLLRYGEAEIDNEEDVRPYLPDVWFWYDMQELDLVDATCSAQEGVGSDLSFPFFASVMTLEGNVFDGYASTEAPASVVIEVSVSSSDELVIEKVSGCEHVFQKIYEDVGSRNKCRRLSKM